MKGTARYEVKDGQRTFVVSVKGVAPVAGRPLDVLVNDLFQGEVVVSPAGTLDYSADSSRGDAIQDAGVGTQVVLVENGFVIGGGDLHA